MKTHGTIGETKLKILAIMFSDEHSGNCSYGYNIWTRLKTKFYSYLDESNLRNVYKHLKDLEIAGFIVGDVLQNSQNSPTRHTYMLTGKGRQLKNRFNIYLQILESPK